MVNYVNTVLVSNLAAGTVITSLPEESTKAAAAAHNGKFIVMNCDANIASGDLYNVTSSNAATIQTIKVGLVTKEVAVLRKPDGSVKYQPLVKWSNEIKAADIKSYNALTYTADTEDSVVITFTGATGLIGSGKLLSTAGKRIIVRLTYKDMPHRYRKWTESYEYITKDGDTAATIATGIANIINGEWKRARVEATAASGVLTITALPYDDDNSVDSLNWANKVRFNANIYYTDPAAEGWESLNKHFPTGVTIVKTPGKTYEASAKLVRDRESWGMGYQGILNRGEGTWPIIKPDMNTSLDGTYDGLTLEFENMYRAADDIQRKTKQTLEIYAEGIDNIKAILDAFVNGTQQDEIIVPKPAAAASNGQN